MMEYWFGELVGEELVKGELVEGVLVEGVLVEGVLVEGLLVEGVLVGASLVVVAAAAPLVVKILVTPESLSNPAVTTRVNHRS